MNISSHEEYGLRCALQLAKEFGNGPLSASKISEREGISVEYVSKFMHLFRKRGLVASVRGTQGGFQLARSPSRVSLHEVLFSLNPRQALCKKFPGHRDVCIHIQECSIRPLWSLITFYFDSVLRKLSLADLLESETNVKERIETALSESMSFQAMTMRGA